VPIASDDLLSLAAPIVCLENEELRVVSQGRGGGFACSNRTTQQKTHQNLLTWLVFASESLIVLQTAGWSLIGIARLARARG
jgi:hypothetical protein